VVALVSKKKEFVYLVQSVSSERNVNSLLVGYFISVSVSFNKLNKLIKENKFAVSIFLGLFIVSSFLLKGF